jgi:hypothetical protein
MQERSERTQDQVDALALERIFDGMGVEMEREPKWKAAVRWVKDWSVFWMPVIAIAAVVAVVYTLAALAH